MKQIIALVHPSIPTAEFLENNPHLSEYKTKEQSCTLSDHRLTITELCEKTMSRVKPDEDFDFVVVVPTPYYEGSTLSEDEYEKYEQMSAGGEFCLVAMKQGESFTDCVSMWEDIFFPPQPAPSLVTPEERAEYAWRALSIFPPEMKESLDIQTVAEYAVDLADAMLEELYKPKIKY